ncbi:glutamate-rich protein 6B isoform 2-T3 [Vipera latastei]
MLSGWKDLLAPPPRWNGPSLPSGRLAILITYLSETQFTYSVLRDTQGNEILAFFTNQGYAAHDQQKGKLRLSLDLCKGSVFDEKGQRQKFWNWWDHGAHVHTPPFQPVRLQLNVYIQLKDSRMLWVLQRCGTTEDLVSPALLQKISSILTRVKKLLKKLDSDPSKAAADLHLISKVYRRMQGQHRKIQPKERN